MFNQTIITVMFLVLVTTAMIVASSAGGSEFLDLHDDKIRTHLKRLNKPAVKSINSPDGDIIDCVLMTDQPAFDHPLLKNHTIQMTPSFYPQGVSTTLSIENGPKDVTQLWRVNGKCPENTVPIQRTTKEDLLRANSIENYGRKNHKTILRPQSNNATNNHEYAIMRNTNGEFYGTKAIINIWRPQVQVPNEFSLAQIWLTAGDYSNSDLNSIEAGWQVYQQFYGDSNTRFFIYWTRDAYRSTGCYNLKCAGFVQTSNDIVIGGSLPSTSSYNGPQSSITILVWRDPNSGNWWLQVNDKTIGYWPASLFTKLANGPAGRVDWGGEIVNKKTSGTHTTTQMGSGHFAEEGFGKASYIRNIQVVNRTNSLRDTDPQGLQSINTFATCYNSKIGAGGSTWGTHFFFGGPGRNTNCL